MLASLTDGLCCWCVKFFDRVDGQGRPSYDRIGRSRGVLMTGMVHDSSYRGPDGSNPPIWMKITFDPKSGSPRIGGQGAVAYVPCGPTPIKDVAKWPAAARIEWAKVLFSNQNGRPCPLHQMQTRRFEAKPRSFLTADALRQPRSTA